ncbi:chitinase, partial [Streptomyces sp. UNOB3_S3]|nr:chitinase [Streptomyces sp. UNOB3_S3]
MSRTLFRRTRLPVVCTALALALQTPAAVAATGSAREDTCAVRPRPEGKVLQGYWENWDGAANGVHPPFGWTPVDDPR